MTDKPCSIFIGFDQREVAAFAVARHSAKRRMSTRLPIRGIVLDDVIGRGLYRREVQERCGPTGARVLWDPISDAPMSTQFAISRFLVGHLAERGWVLFMDCDVLVRISLSRLFEGLDDRKALYCVKHPEMPDVAGVKMDGQPQTTYRRKLWSSVFCLNVEHPANKALTLDLINTAPGRELHAFCWLNDYEIGELGPEWNHLVGLAGSVPTIAPRILHYTCGVPTMPGFEHCEYAEEWFKELSDWAAGH